MILYYNIILIKNFKILFIKFVKHVIQLRNTSFIVHSTPLNSINLYLLMGENRTCNGPGPRQIFQKKHFPASDQKRFKNSTKAKLVMNTSTTKEKTSYLTKPLRLKEPPELDVDRMKTTGMEEVDYKLI